MMAVTAALLVMVASPAVACETGMWITTDPGSGGPGTEVTVQGGGWEAGSVTLRWDASAESGGAVLGEAPVGPDGTINVQVIIPEAAPGQHKIVAEHSQTAGEVTHPGDWSYFTIPGAAPAQEQSSGEKEQQQPEQAERPEPSAADLNEPAANSGASRGEAAVEAPAETVAEPIVVAPAKTAAVTEKQRASKTQTRELRLRNFPGVEADGALRDGAIAEPLRTETAEAPAGKTKGSPSAWWLLAAAAGVLLPLIARRRRLPRSIEADVLGLPLPDATQEERRKAA